MPQYDYECDTMDCGGKKTIICSIAEKPEIVQCDTCGCMMDQVIHPVGQVFKGRGWTPTFGPIGRQTKKG